MSGCQRVVEDTNEVCGRGIETRRVLSAFLTLEDPMSVPNLEYRVDLCAEHAAEYDAETPSSMPRFPSNPFARR